MSTCDHMSDPCPCTKARVRARPSAEPVVPSHRMRPRVIEADRRATGGFAEARQLADEATACVTGDRQADYGHPAKDFAAQALALKAYTLARFGIDLEWEARDLPQLYTLFKACRQGNREKADNARDIIGYQLTGVAEHVVRTGETYPE